MHLAIPRQPIPHRREFSPPATRDRGDARSVGSRQGEEYRHCKSHPIFAFAIEFSPGTTPSRAISTASPDARRSRQRIAVRELSRLEKALTAALPIDDVAIQFGHAIP